MKINGSGVNSALLIDETLDAATPFDGSKDMRQLFPHSVLLAEPGGTSHAGSLFGDLCAAGAIAKYLTNGMLPPPQSGKPWDKTCKPLPMPVPKGAAAISPAIPRPGRPLPTRLGLAAVALR